MLTAKRFGVKVTEFFVGFGPTLWSFRRGETEYGDQGDPGRRLRQDRRDDRPRADRARGRARAFYRKPAWQRAVTLSAGSFMHLVIGVLLFWLAFGVFGNPMSDSSKPVLGSVIACVPAVATDPCTKASPASPALVAGLKAGDRVLAVDGKRVAVWSDVTDAIRARPGQPVTLLLQRGASTVTTTLTTKAVVRSDLKDPSKKVTVGAVGVSPLLTYTQVREGPGKALGSSLSMTGQTITSGFTAILHLPAKIFQVGQVVFGDAKRDPNGAIGVVGISRISGDVAQSGDLTPSGRVATILHAARRLQRLRRRLQHVPAAAARRRARRGARVRTCQGCDLPPPRRAGAAAPGHEQAAPAGLRRVRRVRRHDGPARGRRHRQADPAVERGHA